MLRLCRPGWPKQRVPWGNINAVTDAEFDAQVLKSDKPVLVDFWAEWCGPCRQVAPILDEIATAHGDKITFYKMNVGGTPVTPSSYRVTGIPTINVYQGGEVVKSIVGARPEAAILNELNEFIARRVSPSALPRGPVAFGAGPRARLRSHRTDQALEGGLDLVAPADRGSQVHPHPGLVGWRAVGLKPDAAEKVDRHHAAPGASTRVAERLDCADPAAPDRGRGPSLHQHRPRPPPGTPARTYAIVSGTASGRRGRVRKPATPGTNASGA